MATEIFEFNKSATVQFVLHEKPEYLCYVHQGQFYKSFLNGRTFVQVGEMWMPALGCPVPEKLPTANFLAFMNRNAKWIPAMLMGCAAIVMTHIGLMLTDGAEFAASWIKTFSAMMNTTLVVLALACLVAFVLSQFKKGLTIDLSGFQPVKELAAGGTDGISIAPDFAVFSSSEDEAAAEYSARVKDAIAVGKGWVLVIPFRSEYGAIHTSGDDIDSEGHVFLRSNPPHDGGNVITFEDARTAKDTFGRERWTDYVAYCSEFAKRYKVWAPTAKIQDGVNALTVILNRATFAVCMLLSFAGIAQKSAQVREYLGELRYTTDAPTGEVDFVFSSRVYTRIAGGGKSYSELLTGAPNYTDADDSGKLVGVTVDGKVILPMRKKQSGQAQASASAPVQDTKTETLPTLPGTKGFFESLPDSSELAIMKRQNIMERRLQWVKVEPTLEYVMWRFWQYMMLIVGIGGILWVLSKASATDAIHDLSGYPLIGNAITWLHISTKTVLFLILCVPTVMVLGADVIRYYYTQDFSFVWLFKYAIICWAWYYGFQKIIPNSPGTQGPSSRMGNYPTGNNNQRYLN